MHVPLAIVGAGPAGLAAALAAARRLPPRSVLLLDRLPSPAVKLARTGGGRGNLSHLAGENDFAAAFGPAGRFIVPAYRALTPHRAPQPPPRPQRKRARKRGEEKGRKRGQTPSAPGNESQLAGVLTKKMADTDLSNLRKAQRDTERQAILEGWDSGRKARELKMRWAELAGGMEEAKFVDAAGKTWNTDTYVDMLVGTTAQRTEREGFMEGLARNGDDLVKIEAQGSDACGVCADWDGRILSISGADKRFPSYEDAVAAGMFHPNCRCFLTRVDPEWDAEEIESQEKENAEEKSREAARGGGGMSGNVARRPGETEPRSGQTAKAEARENAEPDSKEALWRFGSRGGPEKRRGGPNGGRESGASHGKNEIQFVEGWNVKVTRPSAEEVGVTAATKEKPIVDAIKESGKLYDGLKSEVEKALETIADVPRETREKAMNNLADALRPHAGRKGQISEFGNNLSKAEQKVWTAAKSFIESAIDKEYNEEQVGLMRTGRPGRSKYKRGLNLIKVSSNCDVGSLVHEWGHHLQNANPHFLERCAEFLRYRAEKSGGEAGKVRPLHKLLPDKPYGDDEFAISDSFWDAYCGKVYSGQRGKAIPVEHGSKHGPIKTYDVVDTELLSMGLQYLYVKPIDFLLHDPEYYGFIMSLLKGEI